MRASLTTPPKIFISSSHDSAEHRRWVAELASALVEHGIDLTLDQWDLRLGEDVAKFMERSILRADRVLMICTASYVAKAHPGSGGAGYEAMIVTGQMLSDLGTTTFIPVVRQAGNAIQPRFLSTRFYIDLGSPNLFKEHVEQSAARIAWRTLAAT